MSDNVSFQVTSKKDVINSSTIDVAISKTANSHFDVVTTCTKSELEFSKDTDSDNSDGEEPSTEDIREAYHVMYNNWLKVCKENKSLKEKVVELTKEKEVMKRAATNYEFLATKMK